MAERGVIRNREFAQQIRDFKGLRFGTITPTDIDGFIDYQDKLFIFFESKYGTTALPYGQRLALERLCDACASNNRLAAVLLLRHDAQPGADIDFASLQVTSFRINKEWQPPKIPITCRGAVEKLIALAGAKPAEVAKVADISFAKKREKFSSDFEYLVNAEPAPY